MVFVVRPPLYARPCTQGPLLCSKDEASSEGRGSSKAWPPGRAELDRGASSNLLALKLALYFVHETVTLISRNLPSQFGFVENHQLCDLR